MRRLIDSHRHIGTYGMLADEPCTSGKLVEARAGAGVACGSSPSSASP